MENGQFSSMPAKLPPAMKMSRDDLGGPGIIIESASSKGNLESLKHDIKSMSFAALQQINYRNFDSNVRNKIPSEESKIPSSESGK